MTKNILKLTVVFILFNISENSYAQKQGQALIDSLQQELSKAKDDTNKVSLLNKLSKSYKLSNPDDGIKYGNLALDLAIKLDWKLGQGISYNYLGLNYETKSNYTKSLEFYKKSEAIFEEIGNKNKLATVIGNIGNIYMYESDYSKALVYYFNALKISEETGDKKNQALYIGNIGNVYYFQKDYAKVLEYYFKALSIHNEIGDKDGSARITGNIANIYAAQSNYPKALQYFNLALKIDEELGNKLDAGNVIGNIAYTYITMRNYFLAIEYAKKSLIISEDLGNKFQIALSLNYIGDAYLSMVTDATVISKESKTENKVAIIHEMSGNKTAQLRLSISYLKMALDTAKSINALKLMEEGYQALAKAYKLSRNFQLAMECYENYTQIKDSIYSEQSKIKITNLETQREKYLKDKQIEIELLKKRHERIYLLSGIAVLLIIVTLTVRSNRIQKTLNKTITILVNEQEKTINQRTAQLAESNDRLAHANKKLVELIQYNAHNLREPLARVMGAMIIQEYVTSEEFYNDIWPQMQKAVTDLDNSIKEVITIADETVNLYG